MFEKVIEKWPNRVIVFEETDSTNEQMKQRIKNSVSPRAMILADRQTKGKGRLQRIFESPPRDGIYFTYFAQLPKTSCLMGELTPRIAVETVHAIHEVTGVECDIKWVNDLKLNGKKIVGILTELLPSEQPDLMNVIIGIGVNVNTPKTCFSQQVQKIASSLYIETGKKYDRDDIILQIIDHLDALLDSPDKNRESDFLFYQEHCLTLRQKVTVDTGGIIENGECLSLNRDYSLNVEMNSGEIRRVFGGEVSVRCDKD